jgi:hypothetical protein
MLTTQNAGFSIHQHHNSDKDLNYQASQIGGGMTMT